MAIPALVGYAHIIVALVTKLSLVCMAVHAGSVQAHEVAFSVARNIGRPGLSHNRFFPIV